MKKAVGIVLTIMLVVLCCACETTTVSEHTHLTNDTVDEDTGMTNNTESYDYTVVQTEEVTQVDTQLIDYNQAIEYMNNGQYKQAVDLFDSLGGYSDAGEKRLDAMYQYVIVNYNQDDLVTADYLTTLTNANYKDSAELDKELYEWDFVTAINAVSENAQFLGEALCPSEACLIHMPSMAYNGSVGVMGNETGAPTLHIDVTGGRPGDTALLTVIVGRYDLQNNLISTETICTDLTVSNGDHFTSAYSPIDFVREGDVVWFKDVVFASIRETIYDEENIKSVETIFSVE